MRPQLSKKEEPWIEGLHNDEISTSAGVKRRAMDKKSSLPTRGGQEISLLLLKNKGGKGRLRHIHEIGFSPNL